LREQFDLIDEHFFPSGNEWIAHENVSVADFAYISTISTFVVSLFSCSFEIKSLFTIHIYNFQAIGASLDKYPRLKAWFGRCKTAFPEYYEVNELGANLIAEFVSSKISKGLF
jgi:glutathione S-transferase